MECKFYRTCTKYNTDECTPICYPRVMLHGIDGSGGFWNTTNVPKKYKDNLLDTLPIKEDTVNKTTYEKVEKYCKFIMKFGLEQGMGLYFYGGTGTGKTTIATTILNEYLIARVRLHLRSEAIITTNPTLFVRCAELQNNFNAQFRGSKELQEESSNKFHSLKQRMKTVEFLVVDDIALRDTTDSFRNELYEIVDDRAVNGLATVYTSNVEVDKLSNFLGDRIASRIDGMTVKLSVLGEDFRKGGLF